MTRRASLEGYLGCRRCRIQGILTWRRYETNVRMGQGAVLIAKVLQDLRALRRVEIGEWCAADKGFKIGHAGHESRNGTSQHPSRGTGFMASHAGEDEPNAMQAFLTEHPRSLWPGPRPYEAKVIFFSNKRGSCGCDECLKSLWRDGSWTVGSISLCGHTTYKSETGQWLAPEMIRVHEQYHTFFRYHRFFAM